MFVFIESVIKPMEEIDIQKEHVSFLFSIPLFKDLPGNVKGEFTERISCKLYSLTEGDIVARQNTECRHLYVLLKGELRVDIIDVSGNMIIIEKIVAPRAFATPHLFSENSILPATFTATEKGILMTAPKESVFKLISTEPAVLKNFLRITGNCNKCTTMRLHALSQKGVRKRIISYLLDHHVEKGNMVRIAHNQVQLAEYLYVTRPALSKEINKMIREGLIAVEKNTVYFLDFDKLRQFIR